MRDLHIQRYTRLPPPPPTHPQTQTHIDTHKHEHTQIKEQTQKYILVQQIKSDIYFFMYKKKHQKKTLSQNIKNKIDQYSWH